MSKPISVVERPISEKDKRILEEGEKIRNGIADVTLAWAALETSFVFLLAHILRRVPVGMVGKIYFTPAGLEVRTSIVSNAFYELFARDSVRETICPQWDTLMNTVGRIRQTRNKVAHSTITFFQNANKGYYRLVSPMGKDDAELAKSLAAKQKPGMGAATWLSRLAPFLMRGESWITFANALIFSMPVTCQPCEKNLPSEKPSARVGALQIAGSIQNNPSSGFHLGRDLDAVESYAIGAS